MTDTTMRLAVTLTTTVGNVLYQIHLYRVHKKMSDSNFSLISLLGVGFYFCRGVFNQNCVPESSGHFNYTHQESEMSQKLRKRMRRT